MPVVKKTSVSPNPLHSGNVDQYTLGRATYNSIEVPTSGSATNSAFVAQYSPTGRLYWVARVEAVSVVVPISNGSDANGNVYVPVTWASGNGLLYNANGSLAATISTTLSGVVKYNKFGIYQWFLSTSNLTYGAITFAPNGDFVLFGSYTSATLTVLNLAGTTFKTLVKVGGTTNTAVIRYNSAGAVQWVAQTSPTTNMSSFQLTTDASGNVYCVGGFTGTLTLFNANETLGATLVSGGSGSGFLVKYTSAGAVTWALKTDSANNPINAVSTDLVGNVYITGAGQDTILYNTGGSVFRTLTSTPSASVQGYVAKYTPAGVGAYVVQARSSSGNSGGDPTSLTTDAVGNAYWGVRVFLVNNFLTFVNDDGSTVAGPTNASYYWATAKISSTGSVSWVNNVFVNSAVGNLPNSTAINSTLGIYQAGQVQSGTSTFTNVGLAVGATLGGTNNTGGTLARYDANGLVVWAARQNQAGGNMGSSSVSVAVDSITIVGTYVGTIGGTIYSAGL